jgi:hypothetical protein
VELAELEGLPLPQLAAKLMTKAARPTLAHTHLVLE